MEAEAQKIEPQDSVESIEKTKVIVNIGEQGALNFKDQTELGSAARLMIKMNMAPTHLREQGLEAVMSALLFVKQFNLPVSAMNELGYVKGKLTAFGSLFTALAERHEQYGEKEEFFITREGERISADNKNLATAIPWAHVMRIKRKDSQVWNEYFFSVDDAEKAGLLTKNTKPDAGWVKYTKDLLYHKTKARGLKSNYASALNGLEYHEDLMMGNEKDVTPSSKTLNEMF
jgi:hypothetical protein